ncbi:DEAD/DEAH box helicase [bacterium]|nr:DEAD/DEAH box helicase [bacterium]
MAKFSDIHLLHSLARTLADKGLTTPTEIQTAALPLLLTGRSVVGVAQTGSGKTLAYALPVLHQLKGLENDGQPVRSDGHPRALVMVPSRELGEQVSKVFKLFTHDTRLRVRTVLGGVGMDVARRNIQGCFEVLVATPGRLLQLLDRKLLNLSDVRVLVFDEADQMLDPTFIDDAKRIVAGCQPEVQLALFSATVSPKVQTLISELFTAAEVIRCKNANHLAPTLSTKRLFIKDGVRFPFLQKELERPVSGGTLIFVNTRDQCDEVARLVREAGQECVVYRGEMDKIERRKNLRAFREGKVPLLVSTDLASRGLDVDHVSRVINYHLPKSKENYVHRVGRTARAGRAGLVVNLVTQRDLPLMNQVDGGRS